MRLRMPHVAKNNRNLFSRGCGSRMRLKYEPDLTASSFLANSKCILSRNWKKTLWNIPCLYNVAISNIWKRKGYHNSLEMTIQKTNRLPMKVGKFKKDNLQPKLILMTTSSLHPENLSTSVDQGLRDRWNFRMLKFYVDLHFSCMMYNGIKITMNFASLWYQKFPGSL